MIPSHLATANALLFIGSFLFRSAGCSWNDTADQFIDKCVSRTRFRPVARGAISTTAAHICTGSILLIFLALLSQLSSPGWQPKDLLGVYYSIPFLAATSIYPFLKRVTNYPQVLLGFMNSWGVALAFPALQVDLFASQTRLAAAGFTMMSVIIWSALNDTIYAFQDLRDDLKVNVKSMAVRHKDHAKLLFEGLAIIQVCFLLLVGATVEARPIFFIGVCVVFGLLNIVISRVSLNDPDSCAWWFQHGCHYVSMMTVCCFLSEYLLRK